MSIKAASKSNKSLLNNKKDQPTKINNKQLNQKLHKPKQNNYLSNYHQQTIFINLKQNKKLNEKSKFSQNNSHRSPQMIKIMINELERELFEKTKQKQLKQTATTQYNTKRYQKVHTKLTSPTKILKSINNSSPNKRKAELSHNNKSINDVSSPKLGKLNNSKTKKPNKVVQSQGQQATKIRKIKKISNDKKHKHTQDDTKSKPIQDYMFLGDNLIQLNNAAPIFILQNDSSCQSYCKSKRNKKSLIQCDEKSLFLRHSKMLSFDSIHSDKMNTKHIERSFMQGQQTNSQSTEFLRCQFNQHKNNIQFVKYEQNPLEYIEIKKQIQRINNLKKCISVVKIQKWWKSICKSDKKQKDQFTQIILNQSLAEIQREDINFQKNQTNQVMQVYSSSQKRISFPNARQHQQMLKLRESSAYLQFTTHLNILNQLLLKQKISASEYKTKQIFISQKLNEQLSQVNKIKQILKQSAKKVKDIMIKTKRDILIAKRFKDQQHQALDQEETTCQFQNHSSIINQLFGDQKTVLNQDKQTYHQDNQKNNSGELACQQGKLACQRVNIEQDPSQHSPMHFIQQINEYSNHSDDESCSSYKNGRIFNSPQSSQQDLCFPILNKNANKVLFDESSQQQQVQNLINDEASTNFVGFPVQNVIFEQLYKNYQDQQEQKKQIQCRIARQLGIVQARQKPQSQIGINTSIVGVHKFLLNFFKFYLYYHKNQFLKCMNMPYGESIETRLNKNKTKNPEEALNQWIPTTFYTQDDQQVIYGLKNIIPNSVLEDFFQSYYQQTDIQFNDAEKMNIELQKIHNKAIFQAFNSALNVFRPYSNIQGPPYLWCNSQKSLTFYFIGEQNIQQVYEKTQMKILKSASFLCGVQVQKAHTIQTQYSKSQFNEAIQSPFKLIQNSKRPQKKVLKDFEQYLYCYTQNFSPIYFSNLEDRLKKKEQVEMDEENIEWFGNTFQENKTALLLQLTTSIQQTIFQQELLLFSTLRLIDQ